MVSQEYLLSDGNACVSTVRCKTRRLKPVEPANVFFPVSHDVTALGAYVSAIPVAQRLLYYVL